jgi:hypothetical protein
MLLNASVSRDGTRLENMPTLRLPYRLRLAGRSLKGKRHRPTGNSGAKAYAENRGVDYAASLTPDDAVDRLIIAGTAQCTERIAELFSLAARDGFTQITLGVPLGPDIPEVIDIWGKDILPALH